MPPAFTAEERERVTGLLLEAGLRLFTSQGLRKTSLDELVRPAGIAKSSFYAFFDSKEALYLELMFQRLPALREQVMGALFAEDLDTAEVIRRYLRGALRVQREDPLYRRLFTHPDELAAVARRVPPERIEQARDELVRPMVEFLERRQRAGELIDADPAVVYGALQCVLVVPLQEDQLDPAVYPAALDLLVELVASGLARPRGQGKENE